MKRSEMFKIMWECMLEPSPSCMGDGGLQMQVKLDRLLTRMTESGMLQEWDKEEE